MVTHLYITLILIFFFFFILLLRSLGGRLAPILLVGNMYHVDRSYQQEGLLCIPYSLFLGYQIEQCLCLSRIVLCQFSVLCCLSLCLSSKLYWLLFLGSMLYWLLCLDSSTNEYVSIFVKRVLCLYCNCDCPINCTHDIVCPVDCTNHCDCATYYTDYCVVPCSLVTVSPCTVYEESRVDRLLFLVLNYTNYCVCTIYYTDYCVYPCTLTTVSPYTVLYMTRATSTDCCASSWTILITVSVQYITRITVSASVLWLLCLHIYEESPL